MSAKFSARLSLPEAVGLSLSIICPSVTAAFNVTLVAQATGAAAPLAFAVGTVAMVLIALSFMAFTRRVAHAGSAYAYIAHTFGIRAGFVTGCALLLTYLGFATGLAALVGSFIAEAFKRFGIEIGSWWIVLGAAAMLLSWWLAYRDMRFAGRLMLALEALVIVVIIGLCISILRQVQPGAEVWAAAFTPSDAYHGWAGIGFGLVFCVLSFAGFEGAATLGEETRDPRRNVPIAMLGTVIGSGLFFVFVSYCEVAGFGLDGIKDLAKSEAPLNDLALKFGSRPLAIGLDLAAAASCFSSVLGSLAAAGRVLFALGRGGLSPRLGRIHAQQGTPAPALAVAALLIIAVFLAWAPWVGSGGYYSYVSTIATLCLIVAYIGVGGAEVVEALREHRRRWAALCVLGPLLMLWVLYRNLYPVPDFPNDLWPYVSVAWIAAAWALTRMKPAVTRAPLPDRV